MKAKKKPISKLTPAELGVGVQQHLITTQVRTRA
jgi:electron transfer flavoprotein alpha/beta subunit